MTTILDLGCEVPLECRATLVSARASASEVHARLAEMYADRVQLEGDVVSVRLVEPLELITMAREAAALERFQLRAFAAARDALDMLREPVEPTCSSWRWVCDQLAFELDDAVRSFVAGERTGYLELDEFLPHPILVVDDGTERSLFDQDEVDIWPVIFERAPTGWFVRQYRSSERRRGRTFSPEPELYVNGLLVADDHPVRTGDRVSLRSAYRHGDSAVEVVAVI